jgi:thiol:disulfide interchange protein DsbD
MRLIVATLILFAAISQAGQDDASRAPIKKSPLFEFAPSSLGADPGELLEPDEAFKLALSVRDGNTVVARFTPAPAHYMYRDRITFSVADTPGVTLVSTTLPPGETKSDPTFGETQVFHESFEALLALKRDAAASERIRIKASYQGCNEKVGVCYPPIKKTFDVNLGSVSGAAGAASTREAGGGGTPSIATTQDDADSIAGVLQTGRFWLIIGVFFAAGIALAFTPCVLPMIPILSGIIAGQAGGVTRRRGFLLALAYVLGMAITYTLAGIAAGLSGSLLANALQNAWVLGGFALVFVLLALSMFGFYELQLPAALQSRASGLSNRLPGGRFFGVFAMGALSALIVSPCVAAPLAGALLYIGQSNDIALGGAALFALALGMGVPLLAVGLSAGSLLPKAGPWMESVKRFFGVVLLAMAIWIASPVLPLSIQMLAWAALLIGCAIHLRAIDMLPTEASRLIRLGKAVGIIALVAGIALLIGALSGSRDLLQPLAGLRGDAGSRPTSTGVKFAPVRSVEELNERLKQTNRPVMLDFYADWCVSCKEMERFTFADPRVQARLGDMLILQADVTKNSAEDQALLKAFGLFGPPGIIFFDAGGKELKRLRVIGYRPPERFLPVLDGVLNAEGAAKATSTRVQKPSGVPVVHNERPA